MSGPPPKDDEDRARTNLPAKATIGVEVVPLAVRPDPPANLTSALVDEWHALWSTALAATISATDVPALRRLFELKERQAFYTDAAFDPHNRPANEDGAEAPIGMAWGSQGQLIEHPGIKVALSLEKAIVALEDRFALTVKARQNMGIRMGALVDAAEKIRNAAAAAEEEKPARADPRLANAVPAASEPRRRGRRLDGDEPRPR